VLKIIWQIKDLDLNNFDVLREQLVGVDSAYFAELLDILKQDKDAGKTIDQTYISNLIDIVFEN
jgi:ABC-type transporter Mla MlaB component